MDSKKCKIISVKKGETQKWSRISELSKTGDIKYLYFSCDEWFYCLNRDVTF